MLYHNLYRPMNSPYIKGSQYAWQPTNIPSLPTGIPTGPSPTPISSVMPSAMPSMVPSAMPFMMPSAMPSMVPYTMDSSVAPIPTTLESTLYTPGYLRTQIGKKMRVEFLIGTTGPLLDRIGTLVGVGTSYILLQPVETDDILLCDIYSIKFVTILL